MNKIQSQRLAAIATLVAFTLTVKFASAQSCSTTQYPYNLSNGANADAGQVTADLNCAAIYGLAHATTNVGIGTTSPINPLQVNGVGLFGTHGSNDIVLGWTVNQAGGYNGLGFYTLGTGAFIDAVQYGVAWHDLYIEAKSFNFMPSQGATAFTVQNNGNVGIGTAAPSVPLQIYGASTTPSYTSSNNFNPSGTLLAVEGSGGNGLTVGVYGSAATYATWLQSGFMGSIVAPYAMLLNPFGGNVGIGTSAPSATLYVNGTTVLSQGYSTTSDARLKTDITPLAGALAKIEKLQGVRFNWRPVGERTLGKSLDLPVGRPQIGFLAQQVEAVVPEAVTAPKPGSDEIYSLDQSKLIPLLVEAIKEQQAEIDELRAMISGLKSNKIK